MSEIISSKKDTTNININDWNEAFIENEKNNVMWTILIIVLSSLPMFSYKLMQGPFLKILSDFKVRCEIPELESKSWNFEQILNISSPRSISRDNYCASLNLNYQKISEMNYPEAMRYVRSLKKVEIIPCKNFVHSRNSTYGIFQEMSLICHKKYFEEILDVSPQYGIFFGQLIIVPLADLFGRKRVIKWGWHSLILSTIITPSTTFIETVVLGRFFAGVGFSAMFFPTQAIIFEIFSMSNRSKQFINTYYGAGVSWMIIPYLIKIIPHWRYLHWVLTIPLLFIPLMLWFLPESPLLFISRKKKQLGNEILKSLKDPVGQEELLLEHMNEKFLKLETLQNDFKNIKKILNPTILLLIVLGFAGGCIYFKNIFEKFLIALKFSRPDFFIVSGITDIVTNIICLILISRCSEKRIISVSFIITCLGYFASFASNENSVYHQIAVTATDLSSGIISLVINLVIVKISPTRYRCTCVGVLNAMGFTMGTIVMVHFQNHVIEKIPALFLVLSIISFIGFILSYFIFVIKDDQDLSDNSNFIEEKFLDP